MPVRTMSCAAVFFCLAGWVYSASANGAEGKTPAGSATAPASIFDAPAGPGAAATNPATTNPAAAGLPGSDSGALDLPEGQKLSVSSFGQIDLHVKDLDLNKVLQLLSVQAQRNIVAGKNVAGTITADLYNVDFFEALRAILQPNGYGY